MPNNNPVVRFAQIVREDQPEENEPLGWFVEAPVGARPLYVALDGDKMLLAMLTTMEGALVKCPLVILNAGKVMKTPMPIGTNIGQYLGTIPMPIPGSVAFLNVFVHEPWPKSALLGRHGS